jgi:ferrous iron transport protein B
LRVAGTPEFQRAVAELVPLIEEAAPGVPNARWIAIRLLDGDAEVESALTSGRLADLVSGQQKNAERFSQKIALQGAQ